MSLTPEQNLLATLYQATLLAYQYLLDRDELPWAQQMMAELYGAARGANLMYTGPQIDAGIDQLLEP